MLGSASNRPLLAFRWFSYAGLLLAVLASPLLDQDHPASFSLLMRGFWVGGAYLVFLVLAGIVPLPESTRLTWQRVGLSLGETALALMAMVVLGPTELAVRTMALIAVLAIGAEHGYRLGLLSAILSGGFFMWQQALTGASLTYALMGGALALLPLALRRAELIQRSIGEEGAGDRLERAYHIARRETSRRHENEQELYEERRRFEGLVEIALGLAQMREQDQLLQGIVDLAADQLHARGALVMLLEGDRLKVRAESGVPAPVLDTLEGFIDLGLLRSLSEEGGTLRFHRGGPRDTLDSVANAKLARFLTDVGSKVPANLRLDQVLALPLTCAQDVEPLGLIMVVNQNLEKGFSEVEADYLRVLSTNAAVALKNILFTRELERSHWELIQALAQAIEAKDSYTSNHVGRVRDLSVSIARAIGLERDAIKVIAIAATLHDVGKISTPDAVLLKPGPLTDEEYEIMKQHAANGALILRGIRSLPPAVEPMVRHHHERWDGKGYPDGKKEADIPLGAQIISIADCYDAMTYDRPYRKGFTPLEALKRMEGGCGSQFNPKILCAFFAIQGYVPKTDPTAISTFQAIVGKLRMNGLGQELGKDGNLDSRTGGTRRGREQNVKPLLLERN